MACRLYHDVGAHLPERAWRWGWRSSLIAVLNTAISTALSSSFRRSSRGSSWGLSGTGYLTVTYGLLNAWLAKVGLANLTRSWLADPKSALTCVAVIHMWKGFGWGFIILLAGLQTIPRDLYEAARIDGANGWDVFRRVTVPLMMPVFVLVMVLTVLGTMQIYDYHRRDGPAAGPATTPRSRPRGSSRACSTPRSSDTPARWDWSSGRCW